MMNIPRTPDALSLRITQLWDATTCPDDRLWAQVDLSQSPEGLLVRASAPLLHEQSVPEAPMGSRVDKLWEHDVVELFLVGPGHEYLELELGAGGHFLVLGFSSMRKQSNTYEKFHPIVRFERTAEKMWMSELILPWKMIPENLRALNAFAIQAGQFMAHTPVPGDKPDFHQPDYFSAVTL